MDKKEFYEMYFNHNIAVNCRTKELSDEFLDLADKFGCKSPYFGKSYWRVYGQNTCYNLFEKGYSTIRYYYNKGYTIIEFKTQKGEDKMSEYNLQRKDLVEGKEYEIENHLTKCEIRNKLLYDLGKSDYSNFTSKEINRVRFKEFKEIKELPKLTQLEIDLLKSIIKETDMRYIARDESTDIYVYENKPVFNEDEFITSKGINDDISGIRHLFKSITFESGAINIQELLDSQDESRYNNVYTIYNLDYTSGNKYKVELNFDDSNKGEAFIVINFGMLKLIDSGMDLTKIISSRELQNATFTKIN